MCCAADQFGCVDQRLCVNHYRRMLCRFIAGAVVTLALMGSAACHRQQPDPALGTRYSKLLLAACPSSEGATYYREVRGRFLLHQEVQQVSFIDDRLLESKVAAPVFVSFAGMRNPPAADEQTLNDTITKAKWSHGNGTTGILKMSGWLTGPMRCTFPGGFNRAFLVDRVLSGFTD